MPETGGITLTSLDSASLLMVRITSISSCIMKTTNSLNYGGFAQMYFHTRKLKFIYVSEKRIQAITEEMNLHQRYENAKPIPSSRTAHSFIPSDGSKTVFVVQ